MNKRFVTLCLGLLLLVWGIEARAQGSPMVVDKIIAKVDNYIVLKSDLEIAYQQLITSGETPGPNDRCELFQQLIINKILAAKAEIDSVIVEEGQIESELERRMNYFIMQAGDQNTLEKHLGKRVSTLKDELREQIKEQLTVQKMQNEITAKLTITPAQVKRFFSKLHKDSIPFLSAEVEVGQIVKKPIINRNEKKRVREQLSGIRTQILNGADFGEFAKKYSEDPGSRANGGDLGWANRGTMVSEFEATIYQLANNEISEPIESDFGFHIIQLLDRRGDRFHARHILIRPKSGDIDLKASEHLLDSIRHLIELDSMSFDKAANTFSDDTETKGTSGYFRDPTTGSTVVSADDIDPVLFFTLDTMKVGTLSHPMQFRMEDGTPAMRIIYYKSYKEPHFANIRDDYQKIQTAAMNDRKNKALMEWLDKAVNDVFIDIDPEYNYCNILKFQ